MTTSVSFHNSQDLVWKKIIYIYYKSQRDNSLLACRIQWALFHNMGCLKSKFASNNNKDKYLEVQPEVPTLTDRQVEILEKSWDSLKHDISKVGVITFMKWVYTFVIVRGYLLDALLITRKCYQWCRNEIYALYRVEQMMVW